MKHVLSVLALSALILGSSAAAMACPSCHHDKTKQGKPGPSKAHALLLSQAEPDYNQKYNRMNQYLKESENWKKEADEALRNAEKYDKGQVEEMKRDISEYGEAHRKYLSDQANHAPQNVLAQDKQVNDRLYRELQEEKGEIKQATEVLKRTESTDAKTQQNLGNAERWDKIDKARRMDQYLGKAKVWENHTDRNLKNVEKYQQGQVEELKRVASQYGEAHKKYLSDQAHHVPKNVLEQDKQVNDHLYKQLQEEKAELKQADDTLRRVQANDQRLHQGVEKAQGWDKIDNAQLNH